MDDTYKTLHIIWRPYYEDNETIDTLSQQYKYIHHAKSKLLLRSQS